MLVVLVSSYTILTSASGSNLFAFSFGRDARREGASEDDRGEEGKSGWCIRLCDTVGGVEKMGWDGMREERIGEVEAMGAWWHLACGMWHLACRLCTRVGGYVMGCED